MISHNIYRIMKYLGINPHNKLEDEWSQINMMRIVEDEQIINEEKK